MVKAIGLDVADGKWAMVRATISSGGRVQELVGTTLAFGDALDAPDGTFVAIDAPIGLVTGEGARTPKGVSGDRPADRGARRWCARSAVFPPPTRDQLASALREYDRARGATLAPEKRVKLASVLPAGMSQQSLGLVPAIADAARIKAWAPMRIFEAHPEVAFSALARGVLTVGKKSLTGALARVGLLRERMGLDVLGWVLERESTSVASDDWIDALAMLLVAADWGGGTRKQLTSADGRVGQWSGEVDGLIALPATSLDGPPARLASVDVTRLVAAARPS